MRRTRSLCGLALGLALVGSSARAQSPGWPGTTVAPAAPAVQPAYPYPAAMPAYPAAMPGAGPPGAGMMAPPMPPLPPQGAACPLPPGAPPPVPEGETPPPPVFPTPDPGKVINGFTPSADNGFSGNLPEDCRPCVAANFEYLYWFMRAQHLPADLVTSGASRDPAPGALSSPHTREVLGGSSIDEHGSDGGRVTVAYWFQNGIDPCTACYHFAEHDYMPDVSASYFDLSQRSHQVGVTSNANGEPVLSRPFFNPNNGRQDADPISLPGILRGAAVVGFMDRLMGAEANLRMSQVGGGECGSHLNVLAGGRWLSMDRRLFIDSASQDLGPVTINGTGGTGAGSTGLGGIGAGTSAGSGAGFGAGNSFVSDSFTAHNRFYGGQLGAEVEYYFWHIVYLKVVGKCAFGTTDETLNVQGLTILGHNAQSFDRGLLAQPSNVGLHTRNEFSFVPELTATVAVQICPGIKLYGGYNLLYWTDTLQPAETLDRTVSVQPVSSRVGQTVVPQLGIPRPTVNLSSTDFWVQGAIAGVEFSY